MIRWKSGEFGQIEDLARRFNAKISRSLKKGYLTPDIIDIKNLNFENRKQLERFKSDLERYIKIKPSEMVTTKQGVEVPKWQYEQLKTDVQRINARRRAEKKQLGILPTPKDRGLIGRETELSLKPKQSPQAVPKDDWVKYVASVKKQSDENYDRWREEIYMTNYITSLKSTGFLTGAEIAHIEGILKRIGAREYYKLARRDEVPNVDFNYGESPKNIRRQYVIDYWKAVQNKLNGE